MLKYKDLYLTRLNEVISEKIWILRANFTQVKIAHLLSNARKKMSAQNHSRCSIEKQLEIMLLVLYYLKNLAGFILMCFFLRFSHTQREAFL